LNHILRLTKSLLIVSALVVGSIASHSEIAYADLQEERADLVRLINELERLEALIEHAESGAITTQRVRFQYPWLRADLDKVKAGIREYLDSVPVAPHVPPPLAGDYIR